MSSASLSRVPDLVNPLKDWHPAPGEQRSTVYLLDENLVTPYMSHYTLELERQIAGTRSACGVFRQPHIKTAATNYSNRAAGPEGIPVTRATINDRRHGQRYFGVAKVSNMGRAYFDALQISAEKRSDGGMVLVGTYTWSKSIDLGTTFSNTQTNNDEIRPQVENGIIQDLKGPSPFDVRHSMVITYTVPLHLPTRWLSGWTVSGTTLLRTGTPFTVEAGSDAPPLGNVDGEWQDRPSILDPSILHRSVDNPDTSQSVLRRSAFRR